MDLGDIVEGQLGSGDFTDRNAPGQISNFTGVIAIAGGGYHSLALKNDGTVWAWGWNSRGQLGNGTNTKSNVPVLVSGLSSSNIIAIAAGGEHSLALGSDGKVFAWGRNNSGQLGNAANTNSNLPVQVGIAGSNITQIAAGRSHSLGLKSDGTVLAWGDNSSGQLGNNSTTSSNVPVQVSSFSNAIRIAAGGNHSVAARNGGSVVSWGSNSNGQLGNGTNTNSNVPVSVSSLTGAIAVSGGQGHSLALKNDGSIRSWGMNGSGQLGNGQLNASNIPVALTGGCTVLNRLDEQAEPIDIAAFPNPSNGKFTLKSKTPMLHTSVEIYSSLGEKITPYHAVTSDSSIAFDLSSLPKGVYFLRISESRKVYSEKIVVQ